MPLPPLLVALLTDLLRLGVWLVLLMALLASAERCWPLRPQRLLRRAFGTDLVYYVLSGFAPKLLLALPLSALAALLHQVVPAEYYAGVAGWPLPVRLALALVVADIGAYWGHRWSHRVPLLWRFHALHHSAEHVDWLVNTRAHPLDMAFNRLCGLVPLYVLGLAQPVADRLDLTPMLIAVIGTAWGFFVHANVRWRFGVLEQLVATPAFHHWHHNNDGPAVIDRNFAPTLPWVDRLFGTLHLPAAQWPRRYGTDTVVPAGLLAQLLGPFRPAAPARSPVPLTDPADLPQAPRPAASR